MLDVVLVGVPAWLLANSFPRERKAGRSTLPYLWWFVTHKPAPSICHRIYLWHIDLSLLVWGLLAVLSDLSRSWG
jgi:hypothetical protein